MIRRWFIRSLALMLLTLCVVAWVGSYWREMGVLYKSPGNTCGVGVQGGRLCVLHYGGSATVHGPGWHLLVQAPSGDWSLWDSVTAKTSFLGIRYLHIPSAFACVLPLWLPAVLLVVLNGIVWRKTRAKPAGRAFPVETTTKAEGK